MSDITYLSPPQSTVYAVISDMLNNADDFDTVVLVALGKDDGVYVGHSDGEFLRKVGMLDFAKLDMLTKIANG